MTLFLDQQQVRKHLDMTRLITAMKQVLIDYSSGSAVQPVRTMIPVAINPVDTSEVEDAQQGFMATMPAYTRLGAASDQDNPEGFRMKSSSDEGLGVKIVAFYPSNAELGIATHMATIFLMDPQTGRPLAIMDGDLITGMRTAAVSAVATDLLADRASRILTLMGSGVQARSHFEALSLVRDFQEIRIWSRNSANAQKLADEIGGVVLPQEMAVRGADVIVTATSSRTPVLQGAWLKPGCHVNAVGACRPDWRELDDEAMSHCIIVDSLEGAQAESGDVILSKSTIEAELGALAAQGTAQAEHRFASVTTVFKSLGMAVEDVAAASLVFQAATNDTQPESGN
jgi:thiomorpholine-carboxylate dehydrogenase